MEPISISNFRGRELLTIRGATPTDWNPESRVVLEQFAGSILFSFQMLPAQAREMAAALIAAADELDAVEQPAEAQA